MTPRAMMHGLLLTAVVSSCDASTSASDLATGLVRDSAGLTIVRHSATADTPVPVWEAEPLVVVDASAAGDDAAFGYVADVTMSGDTLYVLDALAQSVGVFGPEGVLLRRIGGPGDGPGELSRFTTALLLAHDTLTVADWGHGRLHHFDPSGAFLGSTGIGAPGVRSWWRRAPDGAVYARTLERYVDDVGVWRGRDRLIRAPRDGSRADTILSFRYEETDLGGPGRPALPLVVNTPFWDVLADGTIAWSTLEGTRVHVQEPRDESPKLILESEDWQRRTPSLEDENTLLQLMGDRLVSLGGSRAVVDRLGAAQPDLLPAITSVRGGPDSTIWVQRMGHVSDVDPMMLNTPDPPTGWGGSMWDLFDQTGRRLASVDLGRRFRPTRIGPDRVVGVRHDELGRASVVVIGLLRS